MTILLILLFMLLNSITQPEPMKGAMTLNVEELDDEFLDDENPRQQAVFSLTIILAADNRIYWYEGKPDYDNDECLKEIGYEELQAILLQRFGEYAENKKTIDKLFADGEISQEEHDEKSKHNIKQHGSNSVAIMSTEDTRYENLVNILEEMRIYGVPRYTITDVTDVEELLMENYKTKGALSKSLITPQ